MDTVFDHFCFMPQKNGKVSRMFLKGEGDQVAQVNDVHQITGNVQEIRNQISQRTFTPPQNPCLK